MRETWACRNDVDWATNPDKAKHYCLYKADYEGDLEDEYHPVDCWRPSIYMPRCFSRITLEILSVQVERLQDISEEDVEAEGVDAVISRTIHGWKPGVLEFSLLWNQINGPGSWEANPWVWAITFRRTEQ